MVPRQVGWRIEVGWIVQPQHLDVLGEIDQHRAGSTGLGHVEGFLDNPGHILDFGNQVVVLGDGPADLDDRGFLEGVGADDVLGHLPGDRHHGHAVHLGVGQGGDEVGCTGSTGGHADADASGAASITLGGEATPLFVSRQDRSQPVFPGDQGLVKGHAGPAGVSKDALDSLMNQGVDEDVGTADARSIACG